MGTLHPLVITYITQRAKRAEIGNGTARGQRYILINLADAHGRRPLGQFGRRTIERWLERIGHCSAGTRRNYMSAAQMFCAWLHRNGHTPTDAMVDLKLPKKVRRNPRAMDPDAIARLLGAAPDARTAAIGALMVWCGMRCVEVSRLHVEDWDRRDDVLHLRGKGGHERPVPLVPEARPYLLAYLGQWPSTVGPMFRTYRSPFVDGLTPQTISSMVSKWMTSAGVKVGAWDGVSAHALRHTAASDVLDQCGDLRAVQEMLGHADLSTTAIYLRRAGLTKLREAMTGRTYDADLKQAA